MTDRELEGRLRAWYRAEVGGAGPAPENLRHSLASIPQTTSVPVRRLGGRRGMTLLAAAALQMAGGALAGGSGLVRLPSVVTLPPSPGPSVAIVPTPSAPPTSPSPIDSPAPTPDHGAPAPAGMLAAQARIRSATGRTSRRCSSPRPTVAGRGHASASDIGGRDRMIPTVRGD